MTLRLLFFLSLLAPLTLHAQAPAPAPNHTATLPAPQPTTTETLWTLHGNQLNVIAQIAELRQKLSTETDETSKGELTQQIATLEKRRQQIEADFRQVASGVNEEDFTNPAESTQTSKQLSIQQELNSLVAPLISELREITRRPRALEALQQQITTQEARSLQADAALLQIEKIFSDLQSDLLEDDHPLVENLKQVQQIWRERREESSDSIKVLRYQLEDLRKEGASFWGQLAQQARRAVFTRGLNILLALLTFIIVIAALRAIYFYVMKYLPLRQYQRLNFTARLMDVLHHGVSIVLAFLAALLVLYARGDWLLGSIAVLTLIGLILAAKSGLANYLEQVRMLLNLGSTREGERVFINGVPWKVGRIGLYTQLNNPAVGGPGIRIPIEQLMQMNSRVSVKDETWFPCRKGDTILLNAQDIAKVLTIGPDYVELDVRGGQHRWIATSDFMKMDVTSLHNGFAVSTTFGIDYAHQADATEKIPTQLANDIKEAFLKQMPEEHLVSVLVEFKNASLSSLDYLISARFSGDQADNYTALTRALQRHAVDSCNRHNWSIPLPQIVVNRMP